MRLVGMEGFVVMGWGMDEVGLYGGMRLVGMEG